MGPTARGSAVFAATGFNGGALPSPDGRSIFFQRGVRNAKGKLQWDVYLAAAEGKNERRLTQDAWSTQISGWSAGGKLGRCGANPVGREQLFVIDVEAARAKPLLRSEASDRVAVVLTKTATLLPSSATRGSEALR